MSDLSNNSIPRGFRFAATKAGLKASGRTDFAVIVADAPASAAAAFTSNRVIAAPLLIDKENLSATGGRVRVVAINAGNANCAAGEAGLRAARATCAAAAKTFGCRAEEVFPSSTGIIGVPLPAEKLIAALPEIAAGLGRRCRALHGSGQGDPDHRYRGEDRIRSPGSGGERWRSGRGLRRDTDRGFRQRLGDDSSAAPASRGETRDNAGVPYDGCGD